MGQIIHTLHVNITYSVLAEFLQVYLYHTFGELAATIRICCAGQTTNWPTSPSLFSGPIATAVRLLHRSFYDSSPDLCGSSWLFASKTRPQASSKLSLMSSPSPAPWSRTSSCLQGPAVPSSLRLLTSRALLRSLSRDAHSATDSNWWRRHIWFVKCFKQFQMCCDWQTLY